MTEQEALQRLVTAVERQAEESRESRQVMELIDKSLESIAESLSMLVQQTGEREAFKELGKPDDEWQDY